MAFIKSRKHALPNKSRLNQAVVLAAMLAPAAAYAQEAKKEQLMPEITVQATQENDFKADKAVSAKYTEPLLNTPQTITVIKKELIEQQGAVTLTEALRNTPGVGAFFLGENGSTSTGDAIYMRGFDTSSAIFVDGIRDLGSISRDVFNIEQVDVLKGPAGTDNGRSSPTGSVNLISKQPTLEEAVSSTVSYGSANQKRVTLDADRVLDAEKGMAMRINAMADDGGVVGRDVVHNRRWAIAPTFAYGLGSANRFYVDYLHVKQNNLPDGGVSTIGLPGYTSPDTSRSYISKAAAVNPSNFYGSSSDFDNVTADMFTVRIEHDFTPAIKLQNTARYGKTSQKYLLTSFMATSANLLTPVASDPSTWTVARSNRTVKDQENQILTNQTTLNADVVLGGMAHALVGGVELTNEKQTTYGYSGTGTLAAANLYNPNADDAVSGLNLVRNGVYSDGSTNTVSLYAFDTVKLSPQWQLNGGVRVDHYSTTYDAATLSTATSNPTLPVGTLVPTNLSLSGNLVNGKIALVYKPTAASSVYVLYATSKQPPGGSNFALSTTASSAANPRFDPQKTSNTEIGGKWDLLGQKLALTGALFSTEVTNEVEQDPVDLLYYQTGKKRVQGIELGVTGELARGWLLSAGYTRMNTSVVSGKAITASGADGLTYTPKQSFTSWTSYALPSGLKIGGGARFVDRLLRGTDSAIGTPTSVDSYWVFDAMASYPVSKHVELRLNLYNLADKTYVAAINKSGYRYTPGTPRSATLAVTMRY